MGCRTREHARGCVHYAAEGLKEQKEDTLLLGLTGPVRSGKTTAAQFFTDRGYREYRFADPIVKALSLVLGIDMQRFEPGIKDDLLEGFDRTPRFMVQTLGANWGRELVGEDIWIKLAEKMLLKLRGEVDGGSYPPALKLVIPDVRFNNEAQWLRRMGGKLIHIQRADNTLIGDYVANEPGVYYDAKKDSVVENNGDISELELRLSGVTGVPVTQSYSGEVDDSQIEKLLLKVALRNDVLISSLVGKGRNKSLVAAKKEAIAELYMTTQLTVAQIADVMGLNKSTISHHLKDLKLRN